MLLCYFECFFYLQQDTNENDDEETKRKRPNVRFPTKKNNKVDNEVTFNA